VAGGQAAVCRVREKTAFGRLSMISAIEGEVPVRSWSAAVALGK
jgi:hypothetical protein